MARHIQRIKGGFALMAALSASATPPLTAQEPAAPARLGGIPLPAPYQLIGVEARASTTLYENQAALSPKHIVIDLGDAEGRAPPDFEDFQHWTILGERGWAQATKIEFEKRCEFLCGGEEESCYYVAIVTLNDQSADIGAPLAAIEGEYALEAYAAPSSSALEQLPLEPSDQYTGLFEKEDYRVLSAKGDDLRLAFRWRNDSNDHVFEVEAAHCAAHSFENFGLENTVCGSISILSGDGAPLIASYADYNSSKTIPLVAFDYGGSRFYAVRYGAKAQDIIGIIAATPQGWRGDFKGRERALLC